MLFATLSTCVMNIRIKFDNVIALFLFKVGKKFCLVSSSSLRPNFPGVLLFKVSITYLASIPNKPVCNCTSELYPYSGKPLKYGVLFYIRLFQLRKVAVSLSP